jgi:phosphoribosylanthranilate isomerase
VTKLKACGMQTKMDLEACRGADYHGFILRSESPRCLDLETAAMLMEMSQAKRVVVTTEPDPVLIRELAERLNPDVLQVHSQMAPDALIGLRTCAAEIWTLVPVGGGREMERLKVLDGCCDGVVLDTACRRGGGSGRVHDWKQSAALKAASHSKVALAGGIGPHNVTEAVRMVRPDIIDVSSGIERGGAKDPQLFCDLMSAIRRVDNEQR